MPRFNPQMPVVNEVTTSLVEIKHRMVQEGQKFECSHFLLSPNPGPIPTIDLNLTAQAFWDNCKAEWADMSANTCVTEHLTARDVLHPIVAEGIWIVPATDLSRSGNRAASPRMPTFLSQAFTRRSATVGQRGKGQARYPGLYEAAVVGDEFEPAHVAFQTAFVARLVNPIPQVIGGVGFLWSYAVANWSMSFGVVTAHAQPALSVSLPRYVGTQNSRKIGRGQ